MTPPRIYVSHASGFDFKKELYEPLGAISGVEFIFPHASAKAINSKDAIKHADGLLAEVSMPSHGVGIEIGWAEMLGKPLIFAHRDEVKVSGALTFLKATVLSYASSAELTTKTQQALTQLTAQS